MCFPSPLPCFAVDMSSRVKYPFYTLMPQARITLHAQSFKCEIASSSCSNMTASIGVDSLTAPGQHIFFAQPLQKYADGETFLMFPTPRREVFKLQAWTVSCKRSSLLVACLNEGVCYRSLIRSKVFWELVYSNMARQGMAKGS